MELTAPVLHLESKMGPAGELGVFRCHVDFSESHYEIMGILNEKAAWCNEIIAYHAL